MGDFRNRIADFGLAAAARQRAEASAPTPQDVPQMMQVERQRMRDILMQRMPGSSALRLGGFLGGSDKLGGA